MSGYHPRGTQPGDLVASWLERLRKRKLVQWTVAYLAGAWLALEVFSTFQEGFGWSPRLFPLLVAVLTIGLGLVIVIAWHHGERGRQRVSRGEIAIIGTLLVGAGLLLPWLYRSGGSDVERASGMRSDPAAPSGPVADPTSAIHPNRVAVLPFENRTGDPALNAVGPSIADWITEALLETGLVEVADPLTIQAAAQLLREGEFGTNPLERFGLETGAGLLVDGSFAPRGDSLEFQARLSESREQRQVDALRPLRVHRSDPLAAAGLLRGRIMTSLAEQLDPQLATYEGSTGEPPSYEVYQLYLSGLESYLNGRYHDAHETFSRAVAIDSGFLRAAKWQAFSSSFARGEDIWEPQSTYMDSLFAQLAERSDRFTLADRHHIRFFEHFFRGEFEEAYEAAVDRLDASPASEDAVREVIFSAMRIGHSRKALELLQSLNPNRGLLRNWETYWSTVAAAYMALGRADSAETALGRMRPEQTATRESGIRERMWILARLGRNSELLDWIRSESNADMVVYTPSAALALMGPGQDAAVRGLARVAEERSRTATTSDSSAVMSALVVLRYVTGDIAGADSLASFLSRRMAGRAPPSVLAVRVAAGIVPAETVPTQTDARQAAERELERLAGLRTDWSLSRDARLWLAHIAVLRGDREGALAHLREAAPRCIGLGWVPVYFDWRFAPLRDWSPFDRLVRP